ncbi:MAG: pyridoxal-dependent decarboxylase, exosortase A system-associated [Azoarcus sp.]|jgi:diaminopimelate decarboxylase|nr:pyridoxal-dependent decarboxylase, exosortase A system-associated [Azoarcus sp.]
MNSIAPLHAPMKLFPVNNGELVVSGIPLKQLAARVGQTPFYAYDRNLLTRRVEELRAALPTRLKLHYALKANPMPALVAHMAARVDGLDVASAGELKVALDVGMSPRNVSFAGPGKSETELRQAVASGVLINIESFREVPLLSAISKSLGLPARVAVRINPDFELKSAGMKMGGGPKPFGVDAARVPELLKTIGEAQGLAFEGFHMFVGSQNLRAGAIAEALRKCYSLVTELAADAPAPIKAINLGGGFGIPYFPGEQSLDLTPIGTTLTGIVEEAAKTFPQAEIIIELGRYLVGEAGLYVTRILDRKVSNGELFLVVDGGMHHHLAASGNFGQVLRKNYPVAVGSRMHAIKAESVSIVGPLCTPLDILAERMVLPRAEPGDLIVIFQSGAYGASASPQAFLGHPPPLEVLV